MRSLAIRSMRRWGTLPAAVRRSTRTGKAFDGCFW